MLTRSNSLQRSNLFSSSPLSFFLGINLLCIMEHPPRDDILAGQVAVELDDLVQYHELQNGGHDATQVIACSRSLLLLLMLIMVLMMLIMVLMLVVLVMMVLLLLLCVRCGWWRMTPSYTASSTHCLHSLSPHATTSSSTAMSNPRQQQSLACCNRCPHDVLQQLQQVQVLQVQVQVSTMSMQLYKQFQTTW